MADIKWTWNFDVYDESDSPTEEGYYRIIDDEGNEMTDYYFNEPKMTPHRVGYWRDGTRPIIAWRFLGKTENSSEIPNNCEPQKWTKENCKGCKYNEYPYDSGTCFVRVCINGNKYEPKTEPQTIHYPQVDGITPSVIKPQFDKDINVRSKDEPQIHGIFREGELSEEDVKDLKRQVGLIIEYAEKKKTEPQTTSTPYKVDTSSICKIEPQTEGSE